ncbi:MAG TPA: transglutaminase family protein [Polyangia bacterium]|nr:transglutaminase family protein [Polyangia bacterium]
MRFVVRHETRYGYSVPVVLGPHVLRLTPRPDHLVLARSLVVRPEPVALHDEIDAFGNSVARAVFAPAATSELFIESRFEVDTAAPAPVSPVIPSPAALAPYHAGEIDGGVAAFARAVAAEAGPGTLAFLDHLCRVMHARADKHVRPTGDAQSAAVTLTTWRGACRDFTALFLAAVRSEGFAARFCSGYQAAADTPDGRSYLHAWPEVYVPDIGWRGWDPTHGIPVTDGHVALAAAPDQADTMPVAGGYVFDGPSVTSTLDFDLRVRAGA